MSQKVMQRTLKIENMTCSHCENIIEKSLKESAGVQNAKASYSKGTVNVSFDTNQTNIHAIINTIEKLDYNVVKDGQNTSTQNHNLLPIVIIIFSLYIIIRNMGGMDIFNIFPQAQQSMDMGMLFIIGLLTSVHCVAMCGGINLSQSVAGVSCGGSRFSSFKPSLLYNLGRVVSYTTIGALVGALGSVVSFSGAAKGFVQLVAGAFMVIMGVNMLNVFPALRKWNPRMPKIFATEINKRKSNNSPFFVGLLNGLMPCGPLQAMQLYALSTGSAFEGALSMFMFSLGTVPLMFGLGTLSSFLNKKFKKNMMTVSAVLVVTLGIAMFGNGVGLSGVALPSGNSSSSKSGNVAQIVDGVQTVTIELSSGGYEPITVQKGLPVKWIVQAEANQINGCNNAIIVPKYNLQKRLTPGDNIIEFTPTESGTVGYSCWMGMIRSKITVVDDITAIK